MRYITAFILVQVLHLSDSLFVDLHDRVRRRAELFRALEERNLDDEQKLEQAPALLLHELTRRACRSAYLDTQ